ncbi:hypothetical protein B0H63DRAFT_500682 [Podospora didyma]|uniref:AttH domain-containing protein n=1 Tax=Podospora didyma TaxID=330526 RepID=A0AAE0NTD3_9PEZI|nr:hypothetical protein B0H63DRAFT_500682 [Podospora didyma]
MAAMSKTLILCLPLVAKALISPPETAGLLSYGLGTLPLPYNLIDSQTESQTGGEGAGSFWSSSFLHGSDDHDYLVISNVIAANSFGLGNSTLYRASILDITDPSQYSQFSVISDKPDVFSDDGNFNATFAEYGFASTPPINGVPGMRTWSNASGAKFDVSFELSSPVLLNGGLGYFPGSDSTVYEWSLPAGKTTGWLQVNGSKVRVDSTRSRTWYDRQWTGFPPTWTWFALHIESGIPGVTDIPMSIWTWKDAASNLAGVATIRDAPGINRVVPLASLQPSNRTYTSNATTAVYPLDWVLRLADGTNLTISSTREDQELFVQDGALPFPAYEGYVTATGTYKGCRKVTGYGVVEVVPPREM